MSYDRFPCFQCCAVPKITAILVGLSATWFIVWSVIFFTIVDRKCICDDTICCKRDSDRCHLWQCSCHDYSPEPEHSCLDQELVLNTALVMSRIFAYSGIFFLFVSFMSCCCFGCMKKKKEPAPSVTESGTQEPPSVALGDIVSRWGEQYEIARSN